MQAIKNDLFQFLVAQECNTKVATIASLLLSKGSLSFDDLLRQIKIQKYFILIHHQRKFQPNKNDTLQKLSNANNLRIPLIYSIKIGIIKFQTAEDQTILYEIDQNYLMMQLYLPFYLSELQSEEIKKVINLGIREGSFNFTQLKNELQMKNNETIAQNLIKQLLNQQIIQHNDSNYMHRPHILAEPPKQAEIKVIENDNQKKTKKQQKLEEKQAQIYNQQLKSKQDTVEEFSSNIMSLIFNQKIQEEYWFKLNHKQILEKLKDMALFNHLSQFLGIEVVSFFKDLLEYKDDLFDIPLKKVISNKYYSQDVVKKVFSLLKVPYSDDGELSIPFKWQQRLRKNIKTTFIHKLISGKYGAKFARVLECLRLIKVGDDKLVSDKTLLDVREARKILMELNTEKLISYDAVKIDSNLITHTFAYDHYKIDRAISDMYIKTLTNLLTQQEKENINLNHYKKKSLGGLCTSEQDFITEALQQKVYKLDTAISNHLDQYIWFLE